MKKTPPRKKPGKTKKLAAAITAKTSGRKRAGQGVAPIGRSPLPAGTAELGFILFRCYAKSMNANAAHEECCRYPGLRNTTLEHVVRAYQEFEKLCRVLARIQAKSA
jgi:hypothetical protein